jgi:hypothetical protein
VDVKTLKETKFNMNATGDDHVSFSPLFISFNPVDDDYFLVSTDNDRLLMYKRGLSTPVRIFYGANNDAYSQPCNCWSNTGKYVYSVRIESLKIDD